MSESRAVGSRRASIVRISIAIAVALIVGSAIVVLTLPDRDGSDDEPVGAGALALSRLDANDGRAYAGRVGDVSDAARLRRMLRAEFRSDETRPRDHGSSKRARACASDLRRTSDNQNRRVVLLADATLSGEPAVVVAITDRGRVVAFVADAETCEVRMAQSL